MSTSNDHRALLDDPDFKELTRQKGRVSAILTVIITVCYFGFVFLLAFAPTALSGPVAGVATTGIPIGIGLIVLSWILTGVYVRWANSSYDAAVERVKKKLGD